MSIRDIIEAAIETASVVIATLDPEHVALMEAERVAARAFISDCTSGVGFAVAKYDAYIDACVALTAYRKERGL